MGCTRQHGNPLSLRREPHCVASLVPTSVPHALLAILLWRSSQLQHPKRTMKMKTRSFPRNALHSATSWRGSHVTYLDPSPNAATRQKARVSWVTRTASLVTYELPTLRLKLHHIHQSRREGDTPFGFTTSIHANATKVLRTAQVRHMRRRNTTESASHVHV